MEIADQVAQLRRGLEAELGIENRPIALELSESLGLVALGEVDADRHRAGALAKRLRSHRGQRGSGRFSVFARLFAQASELAEQRIELEALNQELTATARSDALTGLGNRRALQEDLEILEARVNRYGYSYCLALFDVDHFNAYNDAHGHQAGDKVLEIVAATLRAEARGGDALYRYGGEEFSCIFPEQALATGALAVERMRSALEQLAIEHVHSSPGVLTISAGLAVADADHGRSVSVVLKEADEVLYRAKQLGRNRVECASDVEITV